jgi:hypothetical protein
MASSSKPKGRKGKIGRNKHRIAAYYSSGRYYWNKARKIVHHMRRYGGGSDAAEALKVQLASMPGHVARDFQKQYAV